MGLFVFGWTSERGRSHMTLFEAIYLLLNVMLVVVAYLAYYNAKK